MDERKIIEMYVNRGYTLRHLAEEFNTNHHRIKRILQKNNVEITKRNTLRVFSDEHRQKISHTRKMLYKSGVLSAWSKGKKMTREHNLKNMQSHLKYSVSLKWLNQFDDFEKLKFLNGSIKRKRDYEGFTTEIYKQFIKKFYVDKKFNTLYEKWIETGDKWIKPSLDHIQAKAKGGTLLLDNLQFISWFENRAKIDIEQEEWNKIKERIYDYF